MNGGALGLKVPPVRTTPHGRLGAHGQGQVQGLEHQAGRAGRADVDREVVRRVGAGAEGQLARARPRRP